jgi:hypothetical protein
MAASDRTAAASPVGWRRPRPGSIIAACGGTLTLASLFLPWYSLRLRITDFAGVSQLAVIHVHGGDSYFACDALGPTCHESLTVGALAAGIWDWRTLTAVGAAAIVLYVVFSAQSGPRARRRPDGQVLIGLGFGTAVMTLAALIVSPVSVPDSDTQLGLSSSPSYGSAVGLAGSLVAVLGGVLAWRNEKRRDAAAFVSAHPAGLTVRWEAS